ncbi:lipid-A-disaccharide synthase [cf. Phormidesmis sp. LEGE 11477]|uniref:lipid-A-disaccharide synthase n=1 Tax=cf. Phormidesmis sp. LEGE 11477 TaxID=1828680 RepID=UPI0018806338|nr:lipid-A-disaccharide synthase [cf. Phormidesmis sp. LEGE 11477]MBE9063742.1 lipid-A-disaccharide synthase [cf. Phormidesmis sp. LEGE 11477]
MTVSSPQQNRKKIFIHTGEVSGDLQGGLLVKALYRQAEKRGIAIEIAGVGGHQMQAAGTNILINTLKLSAIGLLEALPYYLQGRGLQKQVEQYLLRQPPDLMVLLDYKGPNLAVGKFVRRRLPDVSMVYYIAPQEWVFATPSTQAIVNVCDKLLAIFPEEATYYQQAGANVKWVGHPLVDILAEPLTKAEARSALSIAKEAKVVTLLPASRQQELRYIMPAMFEAAGRIQQQEPAVSFLVPVSLPDFRDEIALAAKSYGLNARLVDKADGQQAIAAADVVINKSGTANLEVALLNVPQIVMYRLSNLTALVAKYVVRFTGDYVSPVNLMENQPIVPEFLQWAATPAAIADAALALLLDEEKRQEMIASYAQMKRAMGAPGVCDRAANEILDMLS